MGENFKIRLLNFFSEKCNFFLEDYLKNIPDPM